MVAWYDLVRRSEMRQISPLLQEGFPILHLHPTLPLRLPSSISSKISRGASRPLSGLRVIIYLFQYLSLIMWFRSRRVCALGGEAMKRERLLYWELGIGPFFSHLGLTLLLSRLREDLHPPPLKLTSAHTSPFLALRQRSNSMTPSKLT